MDIPAFIVAVLIGIMWGIFENRAWKEHGENWILGHFKTYHAFMFTLFGAVNYLAVGVSWIWIWLLLWDTLSLDVAWWVIRYYDFKRDPVAAEESYGEPNAWHLRTDWDNWLGLPLVFGTYWWWWVFSIILVVFGSVLVIR